MAGNILYSGPWTFHSDTLVLWRIGYLMVTNDIIDKPRLQLYDSTKIGMYVATQLVISEIVSKFGNILAKV